MRALEAGKALDLRDGSGTLNRSEGSGTLERMSKPEDPEKRERESIEALGEFAEAWSDPAASFWSGLITRRHVR